MEGITRQECIEVQNKFHEKINQIINVNIRMEENIKRYDDIINKMSNLLYGNGRDGLIVKLSNAFTQLSMHFRIIILCLSGILTMAYFVIKEIFSR